MIIFFLIMLLFVIFSIKKVANVDKDYMSIEMTNAIKGIFLCMVFFSHIQGYTSFNNSYLDAPYLKIRSITGQCVVAMFLFYSGYGIMESIKTKGKKYIDRIPVQRFLKTLFLFDCAIICFLIYQVFNGKYYSIKTMLLTFIGWDSIGNSNWYIFCILWLYIFTYIAFCSFQNNKKAVVGIILLSLIYMVLMQKKGRDYWWYDTILCYPYGMLFSIYRKQIESFVNENFKSWIFYLSIFLLGYASTYYIKTGNPITIVYQLWVFCFVSAILTFTMRFVVTSNALRWMGENLFELYILQRLPMLIASKYLYDGVEMTKKYMFVFGCFVFTLIIAVIYKAVITKTINKLIVTISEHIN